MGGSRGSAPTHYRPTPTAPIIYQKIQTQEGWDAADDFLKRGPDIVIIKKGAKGSILLSGDTLLDIPVYDKIELFDPTGAGDSFAGGLVGYISKYGEENIKEALIHATATASFTVSDFGVAGLTTSSKESFESRCQYIKSKL